MDGTIKAFPADKYDALAMLYVSSRDITNATPEEIADLYANAYRRIQERFKQAQKEAKATKPRLNWP